MIDFHVSVPRLAKKPLESKIFMVNRLYQILAGLLVALGALWSVQGAGIVHLKPIACVADCSELQGPSVQWLATGIGAIALGTALWYFARRRARKQRAESK